MQRGRKADAPSQVMARGTFQPNRHADRGIIVVPGDPPQMPEGLTPAAEIVWQETIGRVMAVGVCEPDSSFLARYCSMEAISRAALSQGMPIPASTMSALRQYEEMMGIAGPKSRVGVKQDGQSSNPFARNGRRA